MRNWSALGCLFRQVQQHHLVAVVVHVDMSPGGERCSVGLMERVAVTVSFFIDVTSSATIKTTSKWMNEWSNPVPEWWNADQHKSHTKSMNENWTQVWLSDWQLHANMLKIKLYVKINYLSGCLFNWKQWKIYRSYSYCLFCLNKQSKHV